MFSSGLIFFLGSTPWVRRDHGIIICVYCRRYVGGYWAACVLYGGLLGIQRLLTWFLLGVDVNGSVVLCE